MGLFADLDISSAADNPFGVDDGTYEATLSAVKIEEGKNGPGMVFEYTVSGDEKFDGKKFSEWKNLPTKETPAEKADEMRSWIKQRLASLGVPEDKMNTTEPDDLIGTEVVAVLATKKGYQNITKLTLNEGVSAGSATGFEGFSA